MTAFTSLTRINSIVCQCARTLEQRCANSVPSSCAEKALCPNGFMKNRVWRSVSALFYGNARFVLDSSYTDLCSTRRLVSKAVCVRTSTATYI